MRQGNETEMRQTPKTGPKINFFYLKSKKPIPAAWAAKWGWGEVGLDAGGRAHVLRAWAGAHAWRIMRTLTRRLMRHAHTRITRLRASHATHACARRHTRASRPNFRPIFAGGAVLV